MTCNYHAITPAEQRALLNHWYSQLSEHQARGITVLEVMTTRVAIGVLMALTFTDPVVRAMNHAYSSSDDEELNWSPLAMLISVKAILILIGGFSLQPFWADILKKSPQRRLQCLKAEEKAIIRDKTPLKHIASDSHLLFREGTIDKRVIHLWLQDDVRHVRQGRFSLVDFGQHHGPTALAHYLSDEHIGELAPRAKATLMDLTPQQWSDGWEALLQRLGIPEEETFRRRYQDLPDRLQHQSMDYGSLKARVSIPRFIQYCPDTRERVRDSFMQWLHHKRISLVELQNEYREELSLFALGKLEFEELVQVDWESLDASGSYLDLQFFVKKHGTTPYSHFSKDFAAQFLARAEEVIMTSARSRSYDQISFDRSLIECLGISYDAVLTEHWSAEPILKTLKGPEKGPFLCHLASEPSRWRAALLKELESVELEGWFQHTELFKQNLLSSELIREKLLQQMEKLSLKEYLDKFYLAFVKHLLLKREDFLPLIRRELKPLLFTDEHRGLWSHAAWEVAYPVLPRQLAHDCQQLQQRWNAADTVLSMRISAAEGNYEAEVDTLLERQCGSPKALMEAEKAEAALAERLKEIAELQGRIQEKQDAIAENQLRLGRQQEIRKRALIARARLEEIEQRIQRLTLELRPEEEAMSRLVRRLGLDPDQWKEQAQGVRNGTLSAEFFSIYRNLMTTRVKRKAIQNQWARVHARSAELSAAEWKQRQLSLGLSAAERELEGAVEAEETIGRLCQELAAEEEELSQWKATLPNLGVEVRQAREAYSSACQPDLDEVEEAKAALAEKRHEAIRQAQEVQLSTRREIRQDFLTCLNR